VVSLTLRPLHPEKRGIGGWLGARADLEYGGGEESSLCRPAPSECSYWLSYPEFSHMQQNKLRCQLWRIVMVLYLGFINLFQADLISNYNTLGFKFDLSQSSNPRRNNRYNK
jgi:hypothetical protein